MLLDERPDVVDGAGRLRAAQQVQVLPVARDAVQRRAQARIVRELALTATLGHPRPEDLLADSTILMAPVLCGRSASADSIAISRLSRYGSSCSKQMYRTLA